MISLNELYSLFLQHPHISTDSRHCTPDSIFIALKGEAFNGNRFAEDALNAGCAYALVDESEYATNERMLLVEDGLKTLQDLARLHRQQMKHIPLIAITGTNGKTTTKELTAAVLSRKYRLLYTQGNLNNHIGVPMTLLSLRQEHEMALIEMGANHPGEIDTLVRIADPDYGIITNVGMAHLEGFGSFEGVLHTKGELYDYLREKQGKIFINGKNLHLNNMAKGLEKIVYTTESESTAMVQGQALPGNAFLNIRWQVKGEDPVFSSTRLVGAYNLENALAAACIGTYFGLSTQEIHLVLSQYQPGNNRSQLQQTAQNTLLIDAYNANPTSMHAAIENFKQYQAAHKAVILGGMRELGAYSVAEHKRLWEKIKEGRFEKIILIGSEFESIEDSDAFSYFADAQQCAAFLKKAPLKGFHILLKGSRNNRLENLLPLL